MKNKTIAHADREHAPFGGSVAARRISCTASYAAEAQMPEEESSDAADEGTKAHEVCDYVLSRFLYHKVHGENPELEEPAHLDEFYDVAVEYTKAVWEKALHQTITGKQYGIEQRLVINENLGMAGPADFICIAIDERGRYYGIVIDFKYGYTYVCEKKSDQLSHYSCGLREAARAMGIELEYVRAAIFQPRVGDEPYRESVYTGKYLDTWLNKAMKAAETIFITKKVKFKAGKWCAFCKAKPVCTAFIAEKSKNTKLQLVNYKTASMPDVALLPPEHVAQLVKHGDELVELVKKAKALTRAMCSKHGEWAGFKVVDEAGRRGWDSKQDENAIAEHFISLGVAEPFNKSLKGIGDMEKELKILKIKPAEREQIIAPFVTKSAPTALVEVSDPRPAIASSKDLLAKLE